MYGPGQQLFLGSAFALNQHGEVIEGEPSGIFQDILHGLRGSGKAGKHAVRIFVVGEYRVRESRIIPGPVSQHRTRRAGEQVQGLVVGQQQFQGAEQEVVSAAVHHLVIRAVAEIHALTGRGQELGQIPARGTCLRQLQVHGESAVDHVDFPADRQKTQADGKIADNSLKKLPGIDVILIIGAGQLGNLHDAVYIGLGNLVGQAGGKMEVLAQLIDCGDIDDAVADIDDIGYMAGNQLGLPYGDGIVDGLVGKDASRIKGFKTVLDHTGLL